MLNDSPPLHKLISLKKINLIKKQIKNKIRLEDEADFKRWILFVLHNIDTASYVVVTKFLTRLYNSMSIQMVSSAKMNDYHGKILILENFHRRIS